MSKTGAYHGLENFFGKPLIKKAKELGYSLDNILILKGKMEDLKKDFPKIYKNLYSCKHNRDGRTPEEYAKDLVSSWLFEDYIADCLENEEFDLKLDGGDKNRHILPNHKVKSDSDFLLSTKGKSIKIEIATDYTNYWKTNNVIDLRDKKYEKLVKSGSLLLGVSILDRSFFIIDFRKNDEIKAKHIESHPPFYGKPAYQVDLKKTVFHPFDKKNMIEEIKNII